MNEQYFNTFKIYGSKNQILNRKPSFDEVYQMILNRETNNIINESVFKIDIFKQLFDYINNISNIIKCFNTEQLKEYFPINSKVFKILSKNKNRNNYKLYIVNDKFDTIDDVKNVLTTICSFKPSDEDIQSIYEDITNSTGMFTPLINNKEFSILWLYKDVSTLKDFKHEFIHFLEWINGIYGKNIKIDIAENIDLFEDQTLFEQIFNLNEEDIQYIFDKNEYQTLLNDFIQQLQSIKYIYFHNNSDFEFARKIIYNLFKNNRETNKQYLERIQQYKYFLKLNPKKSYSFAMIIGYNYLNYKIMNIKNHIYGMFKNKKE